MYDQTSTVITRPSTIVVWHWQSQSFIPSEPTKPKLVKRKCKPGQVWKYASGGVACIISVTHLDCAPQCQAILCRCPSDIGKIPRHHDGSMRETGIMESELVDLLGEWVPSFLPPNA